jgi:hypothetical protein
MHDWNAGCGSARATTSRRAGYAIGAGRVVSDRPIQGRASYRGRPTRRTSKPSRHTSTRWRPRENRLSASRHATLSSSQLSIWIVVAWSFASTSMRWYLNMGERFRAPEEKSSAQGEGGIAGQFQISLRKWEVKWRDCRPVWLRNR